MTNPYAYSKVRHVRTESPLTYSHYGKYKPFLRREFAYQCVYCRAYEHARLDFFGADHYRPKARFPQLENEYLNLFYCCNRCNRLKGAYWPSDKQRKAEMYFPNPCEHVMWEHLRFHGAKVVAKSGAGEWTENGLDLNDESIVQFRMATSEAAKHLRSVRDKHQKNVTEATKALAANTNPAKRSQLEELISSASKDLGLAEGHLQALFFVQ